MIEVLSSMRVHIGVRLDIYDFITSYFHKLISWKKDLFTIATEHYQQLGFLALAPTSLSLWRFYALARYQP